MTTDAIEEARKVMNAAAQEWVQAMTREDPGIRTKVVRFLQNGSYEGEMSIPLVHARERLLELETGECGN